MATANTRVVNGINTRLLHNKDYVEVSERTRILHELRRSGEIKEFEMVESEARSYGDRLVWRCSALIDKCLYIGNAEVKLDAPKNTPDGTNPFECAETSAFGRMLAFAGLGTVESLASYDEVARSKPFEAVIEPVQAQRVVEAGNGQKQLPQGLTLEAVVKFCDEVMGPGKFPSVRTYVIPPEEVGDLPDAMLSQAHLARIMTKLRESQAHKAKKASAGGGR